MLLDKVLHKHLALLDLALFARCDVGNARIEDFSRSVNDCKLTARSVAWVKSERNAVFNGRLHNKLTKIRCEYLYCGFVRLFGKLGTNFTLDRRVNKTLVAVCAGVFHILGACRLIFHILSADSIFANALGNVNVDFELALTLTSVECKDTVTCDL